MVFAVVTGASVGVAVVVAAASVDWVVVDAAVVVGASSFVVCCSFCCSLTSGVGTTAAAGGSPVTTGVGVGMGSDMICEKNGHVVKGITEVWEVDTNKVFIGGYGWILWFYDDHGGYIDDVLMRGHGMVRGRIYLDVHLNHQELDICILTN